LKKSSSCFGRLLSKCPKARGRLSKFLFASQKVLTLKLYLFFLKHALSLLSQKYLSEGSAGGGAFVKETLFKRQVTSRRYFFPDSDSFNFIKNKIEGTPILKLAMVKGL
jgi:hypothetical protein